jgi:hypothetical protein
MGLSFARVLPGARASKVRRLGTALAAIAAAIVWISTARADDLLDRPVSFHIAPAPLASALIEFSSQSGVQVAAADIDVSRLNSNGVNGTLPIRAALSTLLRGSGLDYSRVGKETVAIRTASMAPALATAAFASGAGTAPGTPAREPGQAAPDVQPKGTPDLLEVAVKAPRPPTAGELAGDSLHQFIVHHATVHYANYGIGNLAHWHGGKQSICPRTVGIGPAADAFVTARIRAVAAYVGAPLDSDPQCKDNVRILFTTQPEVAMKNVVEWASVYFERRGRYAAMRRLIAFKGEQPIQGWYFTTHRRGPVANSDLQLLSFSLYPLWPQITPDWLRDDGDMSGIGAVLLVIDRAKVADYSLGTIADYAAMVALSVVQSPDHCDPLPSILDVMSPNCATREKPTAITAGDLAFLKALYYRNTVYGPSPSRPEIEYSMTQQLKSH